jgi:hypothetical protein
MERGGTEAVLDGFGVSVGEGLGADLVLDRFGVGVCERLANVSDTVRTGGEAVSGAHCIFVASSDGVRWSTIAKVEAEKTKKSSMLGR